MIISRTPFRISFFGGGTDYPAWYQKHGGAVLATTIDKYCYLTCRYLPPFFETRFRIVYSRIENCQAIDEIQHPAAREVLRYLGMPILGSYDMVSFGGAFIIGFAVPRSSWDKTHVSVDILVERIPERKVIFDVSTRVLALALFAVLTWNFFKLGFGFYRTGEVTLTLEIPLYPIPFILGFCSLIECFVLLADVVRSGIAGGNHE